MSRLSALPFALCLLVTAAVANDDWPHAQADIIDSEATSLGTAWFIQGSSGTLIRLELGGLPPGPKAIHIHKTGTCEDHDHGFEDSGGHLNPDDRKHGLLHEDGPDAGDLPNFFVHDNGYAWAEFHTSAASLDGRFGARILGPDGAALVIHENPDNHRSQPIGKAGKRIACGVIRSPD